MRIKHELELKSKEADALNPLIGKLLESYLQDPDEVTKKLQSMQGNMDIINGLQGLKKK